MSEIRSVSVHLDADVAGYIAKMRLAGAETDKAFGRSSAGISATNAGLASTSTSLGKVETSARSSGAELDRFGSKVDNTRVKVDTGAKSIDRFSGRLGLIVSGLTAIGPAAIPIVGVAIPAVTALGSNVVSLGLGVGVTELAFHGLGSALTAFNKASLNPTAANITAAQTAMDKLPPSTQQFVLELHRLGPELDKLRQDAAGGLVPGVTAGLHSLLTDAPLVRQAIRGISGELGGMARQTGAALASDEWRPFIRFAGREAPVALHTLGAATGDVTHGLAEIFMAFGPLTRDVDAGILKLAQDFDRWATSLGKTKDFQSFVAYIQTNGPKVVDLLGNTAHLFTDIVQAAAPLGGPTLDALNLLVNGLDELAKSPLATPLLLIGQLAAIIKLTGRGLGVLGVESRIGFGGITTGAKTSSGALKGLRADLTATGTALRTLGTNAGRNAATGTPLLSGVNREGVGAIAKTAGQIGALGVILTGTDQKLGLTNTATLGLAGSLAGPFGAAAGATVGLLLDMSDATSKINAETQNLDRVLGSSTSTFTDYDNAVQSALDSHKKLTDDFSHSISPGGAIRDIIGNPGEALGIVGNALGGNNVFNDQVDAIAKAQIAVGDLHTAYGSLFAELGGRDKDKFGRDLVVTNQQLEETANRAAPAMRALGISTDDLRAAAAAGDGSLGVLNGRIVDYINRADSAIGQSHAVAHAFANMADDSMTAEDRVSALTDSLSALIDPMLNLGSAKDAFRKSLNDFSQDLSKNSKTLRGNSDAAIQNREAVRSRISGLEDTIAKQAAAGVSTNKMSATLKAGRAAIIDEGQAAGLNAGQIRHMIDVMHLTPKLIQTLIHADTSQALGAVQSVKSALAGIERVVNVHVNVTRNTNALLADVNTPRGADGMTVPGARQPYGDKTLILAAPGEQVVSNRHGQADRFRADMAAGRIPRYADGGTVAANTHVTSTPSGPFAAEAGRLTRELKGLHAELHNVTLQSKDLGKAIDAEKQKRDAIIQAEQQLASSVADNFRSQVFGVSPDTSNIWSSGPMNTDPARILRQNIRDARAYTRDIRRLRRRGLRGGALAEVDTLVEAQQALRLSRREDHQISRLFDIRQRASQAAGGVAAQFRFGHQLGRANDHLGHLQDEAHETNQRLHQVEQAIKHHEAEQKKNHEHASAAHAKALQSTAARAARKART